MCLFPSERIAVVLLCKTAEIGAQPLCEFLEARLVNLVLELKLLSKTETIAVVDKAADPDVPEFIRGKLNVAFIHIRHSQFDGAVQFLIKRLQARGKFGEIANVDIQHRFRGKIVARNLNHQTGIDDFTEVPFVDNRLQFQPENVCFDFVLAGKVLLDRFVIDSHGNSSFQVALKDLRRRMEHFDLVLELIDAVQQAIFADIDDRRIIVSDQKL